MTLAASESVDSIFYCTLMDITIDGVLHKIVRYFECGSLYGFFNNIMDGKLDNTYSYAVYNNLDIKAKKYHDASRFSSRRKGFLFLTL